VKNSYNNTGQKEKIKQQQTLQSNERNNIRQQQIIHNIDITSKKIETNKDYNPLP